MRCASLCPESLIYNTKVKTRQKDMVSQLLLNSCSKDDLKLPFLLPSWNVGITSMGHQAQVSVSGMGPRK